MFFSAHLRRTFHRKRWRSLISDRKYLDFQAEVTVQKLVVLPVILGHSNRETSCIFLFAMLKNFFPYLEHNFKLSSLMSSFIIKKLQLKIKCSQQVA